MEPSLSDEERQAARIIAGEHRAHLASAWLISGFSLDETRHADIRSQLEQRDAALAPAD